MSNIDSHNFNSNSTPDERGIIFQFPFPVRVAGAWLDIDLDGDVDVVLYDSDGTSVLASVSLDKDVRRATAFGKIKILFDSTIELLANTNYRIAYKPTTTATVQIRSFAVDTAAIMDSFEGGQKFHATERTDAGAWTETTTQRVFIGLICDAFDDGATPIIPRGANTLLRM